VAEAEERSDLSGGAGERHGVRRMSGVPGIAGMGGECGGIGAEGGGVFDAGQGADPGGRGSVHALTSEPQWVRGAILFLGRGVPVFARGIQMDCPWVFLNL
jgi:hypothetical protein